MRICRYILSAYRFFVVGPLGPLTLAVGSLQGIPFEYFAYGSLDGINTIRLDKKLFLPSVTVNTFRVQVTSVSPTPFPFESQCFHLTVPKMTPRGHFRYWWAILDDIRTAASFQVAFAE